MKSVLPPLRRQVPLLAGRPGFRKLCALGQLTAPQRLSTGVSEAQREKSKSELLSFILHSDTPKSLQSREHLLSCMEPLRPGETAMRIDNSLYVMYV